MSDIVAININNHIYAIGNIASPVAQVLEFVSFVGLYKKIKPLIKAKTLDATESLIDGSGYSVVQMNMYRRISSIVDAEELDSIEAFPYGRFRMMVMGVSSMVSMIGKSYPLLSTKDISHRQSTNTFFNKEYSCSIVMKEEKAYLRLTQKAMHIMLP